MIMLLIIIDGEMGLKKTQVNSLRGWEIRQEQLIKGIDYHLLPKP